MAEDIMDLTLRELLRLEGSIVGVTAENDEVTIKVYDPVVIMYFRERIDASRNGRPPKFFDSDAWAEEHKRKLHGGKDA